MKRIKAFLNPERYHGWGRKRRYFEGWYFKAVDHYEKRAFAFIPGIAMDENGTSQAFIQVLDGKKLTAVYHRFDPELFLPAHEKFEIIIGDNYFSEKKIILSLPGISGELQFEGNVPWPKKWYSPGIMGPYSFVPFMECYHGLVSIDHRITGDLAIDGKNASFNNGRGYIEKDWGSSFPSAYLWLQTNHFNIPGASIFASVAKIPWIRNSFTGFIALLWTGERLIRFTTYNGSRLAECSIDKSNVKLVMENRKYRIVLSVTRGHTTSLASPIQGFMEGRINESMTSKVDAKLTDIRSGEILFHDTGRNAGLDVAGKIEDIIIT